MKSDEFDLLLMDQASQLPPLPADLEAYTPWRSAMTRLVWGMVLTTFRLQFFYLNYLLPLLGAVLVYLGCRILRRENGWFRLCGALGALYLAVNAAYLVLNATPVIDSISRNQPLAFGLGTAFSLISAGILFALRQGTRAAFSTGPDCPPDYFGRALAAYLLSLAVAAWCDLVPLTRQTGLLIVGTEITNKPLYYGRAAAFLVLYVLCLYWVARQGSALAGRGYQITPAPVRLPGWAVGVAVFGVVALSLPAAMYLGAHIPSGPPEPVTAPLAGSQEQVRDSLVALGLPEELAGMLDEEELAMCAGAIGVKQADFVQTFKGGERPQTQEQYSPSLMLDGGQVSLEAWTVVLPGSRLRCYCAFYWDQLPEHRLQEQASLDLSGSYPAGDYTGRLLWERDGQTYTVLPDLQIAGGQSAQELSEDAQWWYQGELERLGHLHCSPWFDYSIPKGAQRLRGYLAYTSDISSFEPGRMDGIYEIEFADHSYLMLRHQSRLLQYPFHSISDLGGSRSIRTYGPIQSIGAAFYFSGYPYPQ